MTHILYQTHSVPPTDSIVNEDAVGPSRSANSTSVKGSLGMTIVRKGIRSEMTIGNPIAAIVCVMAIVAPKPII